jgi:hypothetical protein
VLRTGAGGGAAGRAGAVVGGAAVVGTAAGGGADDVVTGASVARRLSDGPAVARLPWLAGLALPQPASATASATPSTGPIHNVLRMSPVLPS